MLMLVSAAHGQTEKLQQGIVYKQGTGTRLGSVHIFNKHTAGNAMSNIYGVFGIAASTGDTLILSSAGYSPLYFVVTDLLDKIFYLQPVTELAEVVIKENSIRKDLLETQKVYRSKGVFYTGNPHYYYLFLKPMTFIYENFKSEVKNARKFRKYTARELEHYEIARRFNDTAIKKVVPLSDNDLIAFKVEYTPSIKQYNALSDYGLIEYIRTCYADFRKKKNTTTNPF